MPSPFKFQKVEGLAIPKSGTPLLHLTPSQIDAAQKIKPSKALTLEDLPWVMKELKSNVGTGANEIKEGVKDLAMNHPAELGLGLAAGVALPASLMGILGAGALGLTGRAIDKTHPLTDMPSDYKTESRSGIAKDLALAGTLNGLTHGIFGKAPELVDADAALKGVSSSSKYRYVIPEDESGKLLYGSSSADPMHGVSEYFDPRRIDRCSSRKA